MAESFFALLERELLNRQRFGSRRRQAALRGKIDEVGKEAKVFNNSYVETFRGNEIPLLD